MADDQQKKLQELSEEYQKIQEGRQAPPQSNAIHFLPNFIYLTLLPRRPSDIEQTILARQKLESQHTESQSVSREFSNLAPGNQIYKLIGPILLKQDKSDAQNSVNGRLEFISKEIKRVEGQIQELQEKAENLKTDLVRLQSGLQQQQQQQGVKAG